MTCLNPKTCLIADEKNCQTPDEKSHGLGVQDENHAYTNGPSIFPTFLG